MSIAACTRMAFSHTHSQTALRTRQLAGTVQQEESTAVVVTVKPLHRKMSKLLLRRSVDCPLASIGLCDMSYHGDTLCSVVMQWKLFNV